MRRAGRAGWAAAGVSGGRGEVRGRFGDEARGGGSFSSTALTES